MRGIVLIAALALIACDPSGNSVGGPERRAPGEGATSSGSAAVPENAIRVGDEYYMVPLAERVRDCRAYRPFSPTRRVQQAIHYRAADGRFVMDRDLAVCD